MKLSGCFSEMPDSLKNAPILDICIALQPYLAVVLGAFGAERIMFGSDWPVCTVGVNDDGDGGWKGEGEGGSGAWVKWKKVVEKFCWLCSLGDEEQIWIWSGTAIKAYGIRELM
jgi:L-rhamnono-1,4-lactonase